jgi:fibronectin-binding autotransporter adhesin
MAGSLGTLFLDTAQAQTTIPTGETFYSVANGGTLALGAITRTAGNTATFGNTNNGTISGTGTLLNSILPWATVSNTGTSAAGANAGFTFGTVTGGNVVAYTGATSATGFNWTVSNPATTNYDVAGTGTGTLTLSSGTTHTYTWNTNVTNGNISTSTATTVQTGATLGGTGTVGAVSVQTDGTLAPGNSPGHLTAATLSLAGNANFNIAIDKSLSPTNDSVTLTGNFSNALAITTGANLNLVLGGTFALGDRFTLASYSTANGT